MAPLTDGRESLDKVIAEIDRSLSQTSQFLISRFHSVE